MPLTKDRIFLLNIQNDVYLILEEWNYWTRTPFIDHLDQLCKGCLLGKYVCLKTLFSKRKTTIRAKTWGKFNQEEACDWSTQEGNYDTHILCKEEEQTRGSLQKIATLLSSPPPSTHDIMIIPILLGISSSKRIPCFRSLQEIYEVIENQNDPILLFLFANCELINFE